MVRTIQLRGLLRLGVLAVLTITIAVAPESVQAISTAQTTLGNNPPPDIGAVVLADPTFSFFSSFTCPSGRNKSEPVGEGYIFKVTGKCVDTSTMAGAISYLDRVSFPDGEVRLDFKIVSGHDRANFVLGVREQPASTTYADYQAVVVPGLNHVSLHRDGAILATRRDLNGLASRDDWNTLAVRARGSELWVLLNDQLVLQVTDPTYDHGYLFIGLQRLGDINDEPETAMVIRNLRISSLASGDPNRVPTLQLE